MPKKKDTLGTLFQDVARLRVFCYNTMLKEIDLTATQSLVILTLLDKEGVIQGDLARTLGIRAVTLGGIVDRMEAKGWLERRPDDKDRRAKRIWLTNKGRELEEAIRLSLKRVHDVAIEDIPDERVDQLFETITVIRANLLEYKGRQEGAAD
jgi:MarR family transcriptional regulator for hemolysin